MDFPRESIAESDSVGCHNERRTVVVTRNTKVLAHDTCLERIFLQTGTQQLRSDVVRFGACLPPAEKVADYEPDIASAGDDRYVIDTHRAAWHTALHTQHAVDVQVA